MAFLFGKVLMTFSPTPTFSPGTLLMAMSSHPISDDVFVEEHSIVVVIGCGCISSFIERGEIKEEWLCVLCNGCIGSFSFKVLG